jgi:NDP-sugar pyrophosphorylase family protein
LTADDFSIVPVWKRARHNGLSIRVYETPGVYWKDTGSPAALAQIHFDRLDGRVDLSVAPDMVVDQARAIAAPSSVGPDRLNWFGRYVWCDIGDVPEQCSISHSIIMPGSIMARNTIITNTLLSPWGICAL